MALQSGAVVQRRCHANAFEVQWNGAGLYNQTNLGVFAWTNMQFVVSATNPATSLVFGAQNDNDYFSLDDVGVQAIPAPSFVQAAWANGSLMLSWTALDGLVYYQLQYAPVSPPQLGQSGGPVAPAPTVSSPHPTFCRPTRKGFIASCCCHRREATMTRKSPFLALLGAFLVLAAASGPAQAPPAAADLLQSLPPKPRRTVYDEVGARS